MKKLFVILPLALLFLTTSCGDDNVITCKVEGADLTLTFKGMFGDQELDLNTTSYTYQGMPITFSKFDFFVYNVSLYTDQGLEQTELIDIEFVDLNNDESEFTINIPGVPIGEYSGISLAIGVPSDLNAMQPGDFSSTHPLGITNVGHHWAAWDSYIFSKVEGRLDNGGQTPLFFSYHPGTDELYRSGILKSHPLNLEVGDSETVTIYADVEKLLVNGGGLDIEMYPDSHNPEEIFAAEHIMDNFSSAISVE